MSEVVHRDVGDLAVGDYIQVGRGHLPPSGGEGTITRIEDNPARGSTGSYRRVYFKDVATNRVRSFSVYPAEMVPVVVEPESKLTQRVRDFQMTDYLYEALAELARQNEHSVSEEARRAIEHWVESAGLLRHGPDKRRKPRRST